MTVKKLIEKLKKVDPDMKLLSFEPEVGELFELDDDTPFEVVTYNGRKFFGMQLNQEMVDEMF